MKKLFKLIGKYLTDIMIFMMIVALLILESHFIWDHNKDGIFQTSCYILCWIGWYFIWKRSNKRKHECDVLKALCAHLVVDNIICDKKKTQDNPGMKVPVWRKCGPGHAFKEDAIIVGLGEDKDPRLVKCAVNASKYLLVSDLLKYLPEEEDKDAAEQ